MTTAPDLRSARFANRCFPRLMAAGVALLLGGCASMSPGPAEPAADEADIIVHRDLVYAERSDGPLRADLYRPRLGRYPDVVVVHPGGWVSGESPTSRN